MFVQDVPLNRIVLSDNDRTKYTGIKELAESIKENGLIHPVTLRPLLGDQFELIAGFRRYYAHLDLECETIPAHVEGYTDEQAANIMWIENDSRTPLDPIDEANALQKRMDKLGLTVPQLAEKTRRSETWIKDRLALLQLVEQAQHLLRSGQLKIGFALAMVTLDHNRQQIALKSLSDLKTLKQFGQLCGKLQAEQAQESLFDWSEFMKKAAEENAATKQGADLSGIPDSVDLPPVQSVDKGSAGDVIECYIRTLQAKGKDHEAQVIGHVYKALLEMNYMKPGKRK